MYKLIKLKNNKTLKTILGMHFAAVIVGITISNEWIILASTILMIVSAVAVYFKLR
ncbi:MAG: hypothetical protein ABUK08_08270 [Candidatus Humimicrobiaceae bacterium]